jgi:hypothetical protein
MTRFDATDAVIPKAMPLTEEIKTAIGARTRLRRLASTARRCAWSMGLQHTNPRIDNSSAAASPATVIVLGMHRSGTSVVAGMLEDQGFASGADAEGNRGGNLRGMREHPGLVLLNHEILELNGASWRVPPTSCVRFTHSQLRRRNKLLASARPTVLKDPRMLLVSELWCHSQVPTIGVIRNPVAVSCSLRRRDPQMRDDECLGLWEAYNERLLAVLAQRPFPVIEFGGSCSIYTQVTAALCFHGFRPEQAFRFFDPGAVHSAPDEREWRHIVSPRLTELWDQILACAADPEVIETCAS